jgi:SSS family solute:Na+ symporter
LINKQATDDQMVKVGRISGFVALMIALVIAPQLGSLGQVFQFIQEYTGVVSPGILVGGRMVVIPPAELFVVPLEYRST